MNVFKWRNRCRKTQNTDMVTPSDNWVRIFDIPDTSKHKKGFTVYRVISMVRGVIIKTTKMLVLYHISSYIPKIVQMLLPK